MLWLVGWLLRLGELGHSFSSLRHSVAGELAGEDQADGGLDLTGAQGGLLVDTSEVGSLGGDALEEVVDEGVNDLLGTASQRQLGVDGLQGAGGVDVPAALGLPVGGALLG